MAEVMIRFVRSTDPHSPIANASDYERSVDVTVLPEVGDWIQFKSGRHKVESRTWEYGADAPSCTLEIYFVGQRL